MTSTSEGRVSLALLARRLGLAKSTVSEALNGHHRIAQTTRERVQRMAAELGYVPHLAAAAAGAGRFRGVAPLVHGLILTDRPASPPVEALMAGDGRDGFAWESQRISGMEPVRRALRKARDRGCDVVCLDGNLGMTGAELASLPEWRHFVCLGMGGLPGDDEYPFDMVMPDYFDGVLRCIREAWRRGYRKIGGCLLVHQPRLLDDFQRLAAFKLGTHMGRVSALFLHEGTESSEDSQVRFERWLKRHRPDAVVAFNVATYWWIRGAGRQVSADIGLAVLRAEDRSDDRSDDRADGLVVPSISGTARDLSRLAEVIRAELRGRLFQGLRGLPAHPKRLLLESTWVEGETLPERGGGGGE